MPTPILWPTPLENEAPVQLLGSGSAPIQTQTNIHNIFIREHSHPGRTVPSVAGVGMVAGRVTGESGLEATSARRLGFGGRWLNEIKQTVGPSNTGNKKLLVAPALLLVTRSYWEQRALLLGAISY